MLVLLRNGQVQDRFGFLYRHGFNPKSPEKIETERVEAEKYNQKVYNFIEERNYKRREARRIFYSLHPEDQFNFQMEYEHSQAQNDLSIKIRGRVFEDLLIRELNLEISLFEEIKKVHRIKRRLREIIVDLKGIIHKRNKDEIESTEFVRVYKSCAKELNELDSELKSLQTA